MPTLLTLYLNPHAVTKDDHYEGYLIPTGAGVINNAYTISSNPNRHPDPRRFDPERYKDDQTPLQRPPLHLISASGTISRLVQAVAFVRVCMWLSFPYSWQ